MGHLTKSGHILSVEWPSQVSKENILKVFYDVLERNLWSK